NKKRFNSYLRIAATILLFTLTGVSLYIYDKYYTNTNQIASHDNSQQRKTPSTFQDEEIENSTLLKTSEQNGTAKNRYTGETTLGSKVQQHITAISNTSRLNSDNIIPSQKDLQAKNEVDNVISSNSTVANPQPAIGKVDTSQTPEQINSFAKQNLPVNSYELEYAYQSENSLKGILRLGANVSSIVNYDQANHNSKLHMGFGIFVEIPLLEDLVVYSGVLFTNQSINFQNVTEQSIAIGKHVKSKNLLLMGFDIPINLKYRFDFAKTRFFVSTGVSSLTFLHENIETTYDVRSAVSTLSGSGITIFQTVSKEEMETKSLGSFNDFFFAKILNVSFGLELPLNSKNILLIEPYLKYSVGPLKSVEAYPSIFGLNLGIMF
ncbi:MAG: hypothetical protein Q8S39_12510, partial [Ignavibacteria bacterium]|nr:hypothetical protein [Ignavibacteria bacterium]